MDRRPGCLTGLLELFFLRSAYNWGQRNFGFGRGGCGGCGCGCLLLIIFFFFLFSVLFGTNWTHLRLLVPSLMMLV
jgi:hypothetical protein